MRIRLLPFICLLAYCAGNMRAQTAGEIVAPVNLYKEGKELFLQKNYAAAIPALQSFVNRQSSPQELFQEAEYMLVCSVYELNDPTGAILLKAHLKKYPDSPHANRIHTLLAAIAFYQEDYEQVLKLLLSSQIDILEDRERDDATYHIAVSYMKMGNLTDAATWFDMLRVHASSSRYQNDCTYYISYIRYTQQKYDEALEGFLSLHNDTQYSQLIPYYTAEIYLFQKQYDKVESIAQSYLATYPQNAYTAEMYRILEEAYYRKKEPLKAVTAFEEYTKRESSLRRTAFYLAGLSYYQLEVYSKAATALEQVVPVNDELTQNAYLHLGLSYLQSAQKNKARMAFEQASAMNTDLKVKEKAAYNYALCIHETSFSAFGESVTVFERFLNEFPNSAYAGKVSSYLVETYMNTRSYEAALKSIERIAHPSNQIMEAKQKILFQLGTQSFANAAFKEAIDYFDLSTAIGKYNKQTQADASYWRGEAYYRTGNMQRAARNFNDYLQSTGQKKDDTYALAHYNLGYTAFNQKNYALALTWFKKYANLVKQKDETVADAYNRIGDCHLQTRNFNEAKQYYAQAESMEGQSGDYSFYQIALVLGLQKDYSGKITTLNRLIGKYPSSPYIVNAIYEKGRAYVLMNNNRQAIATFRELTQKYPGSQTARMAAAEIGLLYYQNEDYDNAIEAYKYVIKKYPRSEEARTSLRDLKSIYIDINKVSEFAAVVSTLPGNIHFDVSEEDSLTYVAAENIYMRGKTKEAGQSFDAYLQSFPEGAFGLNAHYYLCMIGKAEKNYDMILLHSGKLLEYPDNPFSEQVLVMRAEVQYQLQQYADALVSYKMLKEKTSDAEHRLTAQTGILRCAFLTDDDTETIQAADDLLSIRKLSPELTSEAMYCRAKSYLNQKNDNAAMNDLKTLAKDTRNSFGAEAKFLIANLLYTNKNYAEAEKELLGFIERGTPHAYWLARSFILLSDTYVATGRIPEARQYLLSLQQNYQANDHIGSMIESRLRTMNEKR
ncbi:Outer membrane protein assembly factor BamD [termite gut metagenome]|uniref:Outer membrane protein assembly factor BamD n=1 Tax=termite gut metagenome TaxID=433724 RepID=A0A5J4RNZ1_9ZZZZ